MPVLSSPSAPPGLRCAPAVPAAPLPFAAFVLALGALGPCPGPGFGHDAAWLAARSALRTRAGFAPLRPGSRRSPGLRRWA